MQKRKRYLILLPLLTLLVSGVPLLIKNNTEVSAGPRPTKINMTTMDDDGLASYYSRKGGFSNVRGETLLSALHYVIKDHTEYNYDSSTDRTIYKIIDRNWDLSPLTTSELNNFNYTTDNPYIHKLYADYNYSNPDRFKNPGADRVSFDKEHIWAQSLGDYGRTTGAGSDFHALWPSDVAGNQHAHSNYNFAVPTSNIVNKDNDKGSYVGRYGNIPGTSNKVFEPINQYKGDIARAMMYMVARYYIYENETKPKLTLVNGSPSAIKASPTQAGLAGDLATLLLWNEQDPVSPYEIKRNNLLYYNYQQNRNPFIDHPEWARIAFDPNYVGDGASSSQGGGVIEQEELLGISITNAPETLKLGETFDTSNLTVTAHYRLMGDENISNSSPSLTFDLPDTSKLGMQAINASYTYLDTTKHTSVYVHVTNEDVQVGDKITNASDLFISEYIEGSSNNKGLELYNGTGSAVNLSSYKLRLYNNGSTTPNATLNLSGTLAHGSTYTIVNSQAVTALKNKGDTTSGVTGYNGDDAVGLYKNEVLIDLIGEIGIQKKWAGTGANGVQGSTENRTLVRADFVKKPNVLFSFEEWNVYAEDTFTYFGSHYMNPITPGISKETQASAWATYFLDITSGYCESLEGFDLVGNTWNTLGDEYNYMDSTSKTLYKNATPNPNNTTDITGAKARYIYLVTKYSELYANNFMVDEYNNSIYIPPSVTNKENNKKNAFIIVLVLTSLVTLGYAFINRKKIKKQ